MKFTNYFKNNKSLYYAIYCLLLFIILASCGHNSIPYTVKYIEKTKLDSLWKDYFSGNYNKLLIEEDSLLLEYSWDNNINLLYGRTYTEIEKFENAIPYLLKVTKNVGSESWQQAWAYAYLGTCYYMQGRNSKAKKAFEKCIDLNATRNVNQFAKMRMLLFGFNEFYDNWSTVSTKYFRFHFQNKSASNLNHKRFIFKRSIAYNTINEFFNSKIPKKIDFFVWDSDDDALKLFERNLGFSNTRYCVIHSHYKQTPGHELTHILSPRYVEDVMVYNKPSDFIFEGTSVYFDLSGRSRELMVEKAINQYNKDISIIDLWENFRSFPEGFSYPIAGYFIQELIKIFGKEKYLEFYADQSYENALNIFGPELVILITDIENKFND